ncbi:MAG: energy transducer TonB [Burkholderiaceae bacterium]|uniref:Energy transducer TonB n=1 Tax=Cupriavidus metallidurans TaxID=119219 RepID=A0A2L0XA72_9BURK|nr:energy transducer TonB [Cupriavidus metallidurans]PCH55054.1 MAG: energy transducer TonB [Burkholderiaceae bacterium]QBP11060.1 energy transducer TonB [Cupriavidus metallidurans]
MAGVSIDSRRRPPIPIVNAVFPAPRLPRHPREWWQSSSTLTKALAISVAVHALLLMVRVAAPEVFEIKRSDPQLDVVLVNSKSAVKPRNPTVLAQANLDGGGEHDAQRATTPLPAQTESKEGDLIKMTQRRVEQLEEEQRRLMTQSREAAPAVRSQPVKPGEQRSDQPTRGQDDRTSNDEMARLEAEIGRNLEHYAKRPKRMQLTATSAQGVDYAQYYDRLRRKIETRGTSDFPQRNGKPIYGQLILVINVNRQGKLGYNRDGYNVEAIDVAKSSGDPSLDRQAVAIVRAAAPFGAFTAEMQAKQDILEVVSTFKFTRSGLDVRLQGR